MNVPHLNVATGSVLIGRTKELAILQRCYHQALDGEAPMILVEGEAGIGKTYFLEAFIEWAERQGAWVLYTTCREVEAGLPYSSVVRMLRLFLDQREAWDADVLDVLRAQTWLPILLRLVPELLHYLEISAPPEWSMGFLTPGQVHEGVSEILSLMAQRRPVVVVLDDLHWSDTASLTLWSTLYRRLRARPVLIVGSYRPEEVDQAHPLHRLRTTLFRFGGLLRVRLRPLEAEEVQQLGHHLAVPEEVVKAQQEQAYLEGTPAYWKAWSRLVASQGVPKKPPRSLRELNERWVSRLDREVRWVLEAAAVLGIEADPGLLAMVAQLPKERVAHLLKDLVEQGVVLARARAYILADTMLARTIYEMLSEERRQRLHLRAGQALEQRFPDLPDAIAAMLARHYEIAGQPDKALQFMMLAGSWARHFFALEEAQELYWNALSQAVLLGDTRAQTVIHEALGDIHAQKGHYRAAIEHFRAALGGAQAGAQRVLILVHIARSLGSIGEYEEAQSTLRQALQALGGHQDPRLHGIVRLHLAWAEARLGHHEVALTVAKRALQAVEPGMDPLLRADIALQLALLNWQQQKLEQARALCQHSLQIREEAGDLLGCARVWGYLGMIERDRGDLQAARRGFAASAGLYHRVGEWASEATARAHLGEVCAAAGALAESVEQFRRAFVLLREEQVTERGPEAPLWTCPRFE